GKKLRAIWAGHVTGAFEGEGFDNILEKLDYPDEYVRSWAVQILSENKRPSDAVRAKFVDLAQSDPSPVVRQYLASAAARLPYKQRLPILSELAKHEKDVSDPLIPRMIWYALEPTVTEFPEETLELASNGAMPFIQESVARRMMSGSVENREGWKGAVSPEHKRQWKATLAKYAPGFDVQNVGEGGVRELVEFRNEQGFQTHPKDQNVPCRLFRKVDVPTGKETKLFLRASYHPHGDWQLRVFANKKKLVDQIVNYQNVQEEWLELEVDLSEFAGQKIDLAVENKANNWKWEFAYWSKIEIRSE
ncbi:MAG: HEAT repeat domain-containing protein, partial [Verrucomicrobiota bacterium]